MDANDHWNPDYECEMCDRGFMTRAACCQHMNALDHWAPSFECETCDAEFRSERACDQHMEVKNHWANYCKPCDRRFDNANNLKMHLNSKVHRGSNVNCPFCKKEFTTASGAATHLETAACPKAPKVNRETLYQEIRRRDANGIITSKLLGWKEDTDGSQYIVSDRAFNGKYWECYLCHKCFYQKGSLNAHLNSPAHKSNLYNCPKASADRSSKPLATTFGHLESESCRFTRFEKVQSTARQVFTSSRALTFA